MALAIGLWLVARTRRRRWLVYLLGTPPFLAVLFSFTATCKFLKIDTFAYLRDVLGRLPTHPADRLADLLPHRWQPPSAATPPSSAPATIP